MATLRRGSPALRRCRTASTGAPPFTKSGWPNPRVGSTTRIGRSVMGRTTRNAQVSAVELDSLRVPLNEVREDPLSCHHRHEQLPRAMLLMRNRTRCLPHTVLGPPMYVGWGPASITTSPSPPSLARSLSRSDRVPRGRPSSVLAARVTQLRGQIGLAPARYPRHRSPRPRRDARPVR